MGETGNGRTEAPSAVWRGAAFERNYRSGDIRSTARNTKMGVKQAVPANYRRRSFVHRLVWKLFKRLTGRQT